jgi:hypothetical protein
MCKNLDFTLQALDEQLVTRVALVILSLPKGSA